MPANTLCVLAMMGGTAVLSGIALFSESPGVQEFALEMLFLISTAVSVVAAMRFSLARLARAAGVPETWIRGSGQGKEGRSMNGDSRRNHH